ncbi:MAG: hypothetical protein LBP60_02395, partial [Spirochaetaceae bacterium]|nr:hypothetical protein [Spirochaetaceae bacterium]
MEHTENELTDIFTMGMSTTTAAAINDPSLAPEERLAILQQAGAGFRGDTKKTGMGEINNHIHTVYSFSPYTPSMAALKAREAGLEAAGSVDHDSQAAAWEMIAACAILGIGGCSGFEIRVSFKTGPEGKPGPFATRKMNNPDSEGIAYMTIQGIPSTAQESAAAFLKPIRESRLRRNRRMIEGANALLIEGSLETIDF